MAQPWCLLSACTHVMDTLVRKGMESCAGRVTGDRRRGPTPPVLTLRSSMPKPVPIFAQVTAYRAGHVLGAAMFMIEIAGMRLLYTGDYSRLPDRHLSAADLPDVRPDIGEHTPAGWDIAQAACSCRLSRCRLHRLLFETAREGVMSMRLASKGGFNAATNKEDRKEASPLGEVCSAQLLASPCCSGGGGDVRREPARGAGDTGAAPG